MPISYKGKSLSIIDRLFTATSALCVTGLTVVDTGSKFTHFGQLTILSLIQIGGLGLMTFSTIFTLIIRKKISVKEILLIKEGLNKYGISDTGKVIKYLISFTLIAELVGAIILYYRWQGFIPTPGKRFYFSIFHSISAFCNAGFSLFSDNLIKFQNDYITVFTISLLIILGGIGFFANYEIKNFILSRLPLLKKIIKAKMPSIHMSLHTKMVLITTLLLIIVGMVLIEIFDYNTISSQGTIKTNFMIPYFQSVTARTAGFNTINIGALSNSTLVIIIVLMFIGGSPGSTAGGIKTTTISTLFFTLKSLLKGKNRVEAFSKTIPQIIIMRAIVILIIALSLILTAFIIMLAVEHNRIPPLSLLFEIISAFGTVGLSTGITSSLSPISKLLLIILMFTGRIGPLTIAISITEKEGQLIKYPEENLSVG